MADLGFQRFCQGLLVGVLAALALVVYDRAFLFGDLYMRLRPLYRPGMVTMVPPPYT